MPTMEEIDDILNGIPTEKFSNTPESATLDFDMDFTTPYILSTSFEDLPNLLYAHPQNNYHYDNNSRRAQPSTPGIPQRPPQPYSARDTLLQKHRNDRMTITPDDELILQWREQDRSSWEGISVLLKLKGRWIYTLPYIRQRYNRACRIRRLLEKDFVLPSQLPISPRKLRARIPEPGTECQSLWIPELQRPITPPMLERYLSDNSDDELMVPAVVKVAAKTPPRCDAKSSAIYSQNIPSVKSAVSVDSSTAQYYYSDISARPSISSRSTGSRTVLEARRKSNYRRSNLSDKHVYQSKDVQTRTFSRKDNLQQHLN
ncbi:hypothetical protein FPQ18DRAFT_375656 [Pyronema domesticum]|nr:hypothetical protein FPQ18DRAFT_375656 [Pyronema domesticum]